MELIFLIGMPAAGKTYWANSWAKYAHWKMLDMDEQLETRKGKPIATIFEEEGEEQFRIYERELLLQIIAATTEKTIIACGGGTPVFFDNLEQMKRAGCVIYLQSSIDILIDHLQHEPAKRPLLQSAAITEKLSGLLAQRATFYEQAHLILPSSSLTDTTFTEILKTCTNRHL